MMEALGLRVPEVKRTVQKLEDEDLSVGSDVWNYERPLLDETASQRKSWLEKEWLVWERDPPANWMW